MTDSRFTEAERIAQRMFRNQSGYCERFSTSYGRIMSPSMIRLRRAWFQIHKWAGIILAILIIPISLSGAALVWGDWLNEQINPQRFPDVTAPLLQPSVYAAAASKVARPGEQITNMNLPGQRGSVQVTLVKPSGGGGRPERAWVWLDPKTAEPIERAGASEGMIRTMHVLHGSLMVPGTGRQIVGWVGVAMLLSSLTGLWLWWPLKGSVRQGFRWKRRPDFNSNLHHLGGFWIALPLAALSLTGVLISFPAYFFRSASAPAAAIAPGSRGPVQQSMQPKLGLDQVLATARPLAGGSQATMISWPTSDKPEWKITFPADSGASKEVRVKEADGSAALIPEKPETKALLVRRIHDGTGMPVAWQIIIFVGGILPAVLAVTGILMWLRMRRRREKHRRSAAAFAEAEALAN